MMVKSFNPAKEDGAAKLNFRLDSESGLPLYHQLKTHIEQEIEKGTWKEDEMIPSESELAATYKISAGTVRMAITTLVQDGILFRRQGKGTFVVRPNFRQRYIRYFRPSAEYAEDGVLGSSRVLIFETKNPNEEIRKILRLTTSDRVTHVRRLRHKEEVPVVLEDIFLPKKYFPNLDQADFTEDRLTPIYSTKYGVLVLAADDYFEPRIADRASAAILGMKPDAAAIFIERISYTHNDRPVEYRKCIGRGDLFRCHIALGRRKGSG
jgi:GntR family transcriptional regulator